MKLWKIRLKTQLASKRMPFSLFYLCRGPHVEDLRSTFETFLGFPVRHAVRLPWKSLHLAKVNDEKNYTTLGELVPDLLSTETDWHAIIPILSLTRTKAKTRHSTRDVITRWGSPQNDPLDLYDLLDLYKESSPDGESVKPAFLTDSVWRNWKVQQGVPQPARRAYPETTYFVTRDEIFLPPCMACPRLGYHEAGECFIGDSVCYQALGRYNADARMVTKLRAYDDIKEHLNGLRNIES